MVKIALLPGIITVDTVSLASAEFALEHDHAIFHVSVKDRAGLHGPDHVAKDTAAGSGGSHVAIEKS